MVKTRLPELCWVRHGRVVGGHPAEQGLLVHGGGGDDLSGAHLLHVLYGLVFLVLVKKRIMMSRHF